MISVVLYQNAFTTIISFFLIPLIYFTNLGVGEIVLFSTLVVFLYSNYSFQRLFQLSFKQLLLANVRFLWIGVTVFIVFIILISLIVMPILFLN